MVKKNKLAAFNIQIQCGNQEFKSIIKDLKNNGVIDIFDLQFKTIVSELKRLSPDHRREIYDLLSPIINRKMILKGYSSKTVRKITKTALERLEYIVINEIDISFNVMVSYAEDEYERRRRESEEVLKNLEKDESKTFKKNLSAFEAFVSGGFVISDFLVVTKIAINDINVKVALLNTIFLGILALLESFKGLK